MSFGSGFKFGSNSTSAPNSATFAPVPSFSLTAATPSVPPSAQVANPAPFSFGSSSGQQSGATAPPSSSAGNPTGGLFGNLSSGQQGQQGQQAQQAQQKTGMFGGSGGLFGAKPPHPTGTSGNTSGGSFGGSLGGQQQSQQSQQPLQSSLFGQKPCTGLFGSTTQPAQTTFQPTSGGLFNQSSLQQPSTAPQGGGLNMFGQSTSQVPPGGLGQPVAAGSATQGGGISKHTKFTDLPEAHQKAVEGIDSFIKQQKAPASGVNNEFLGQGIMQNSGELKAAVEECSGSLQGLAALQNSLKLLRDKFVREEQDLRKVAELWETFKSADGRPGTIRMASHKEFPQDFFARIAVGLTERVGRYKNTLAQLQRVVGTLANEHDAPSPQIITQTIQNHQHAILTLAAQLEQLQIRMNGVKAIFAEDYRLRTNSLRDPFEVAREDKGLPPVRASM